MLKTLKTRHPQTPRSKLIEMALREFKNGQCDLTDKELAETAAVHGLMTRTRVFYERKVGDPKAAENARIIGDVLEVISRIIAKCIWLRATKGTKP